MEHANSSLKRGLYRAHGLALLAVFGCSAGDVDEPLALEVEQAEDEARPSQGSGELSDGSHARPRIPGFDLSITESGNDVVVSFAPHVGAPSYALWQSEDPYFTPGDPSSSLIDSGVVASFTVTGGGALSTSTYWRVVADQGAGVTDTSTTVGAWVQALVPGYSMLSFPLLDSGVLNAEALMADEPLITEVWVFNTARGGFDGFFGTGESNLSWEPGFAVMVTQGGAATEHRQLGHVPLTSDIDLTLEAGLNLLSVPLVLAPSDAFGLAASIPTLLQMGDWNTSTQSTDVFGPPAWGVSFDVDPGQGLWVWSNGAGPWPPSGTAPVCGDGVVDLAESCDDGNVVDGDGCDAACVATPPNATPNAYVTAQDTLLAVAAIDGLSVDDVAYDGTGVLVLSADDQSAQGGQISVSADGSFDYDPPAGFWGEDSFTYTVVDAQGATAEEHVELVVRPVNIALAAVQGGVGGFSIDGENQFDAFGDAVSGAGDVDGDGLADLVIGARGYVANGIGSAGRTYVVHGKTTTEPMLASDVAAGQGGFVINARPLSGSMGHAVSGVGDLDGDGLDDLLTTAPNAYTDGELYVVHGREATTPVEAVNIAAGLGGYLVEAEGNSSFMGYSADGTGDVNGDGLPDFVISDFRAYIGQYETNVDHSYVVFGQAGTTRVQAAGVAAGIGGFVIDNESTGNDHTVVSVAGAGDVNGDGLQDVVLGAAAADFGGQDSGRSYVVFGKADGSPVSLSALGGGGFVIDGQFAGDASGYWVEGAGDVNGDGLDDVVIGAYAADPHGSASGTTYVVFGKGDGLAVNLDDVAVGVGGFAMLGAAASDFSGQAAAGVGDVNGDGLADVAVGARLADVGVSNSGRVYVVYGRTTTDPVELSDVALGVGGFTLDGAGSEQAGGAVDAAGDVNGDGLDDIIVGADAAAPNGFSSGRTYVVFGARSTL